VPTSPPPIQTAPDLRDAWRSESEHPGVGAAPSSGGLLTIPPAGGPIPTAPIRVTSLQGWHLPLLDDPAFLPLQPLLQRSLLLSVPRHLISALVQSARQAPLVLVASQLDARGRSRPVGLLLARSHNHSGSCWEVQHLTLASWVVDQSSSGCRAIAAALLREAIRRTRGASSWIATASSHDAPRLATLRELGFQPQRTQRLWQWQAPPAPAADRAPLPGALQLRPLQRRNAALLWHLEQATCPAPLRQLLDRRVEDLLDRSEGRGWLLIDSDRNEAVAAVRWLSDQPAGGPLVELSVHQAWSHLLGAPCEQLLASLAGPAQPLWLHSDVDDGPRQDWLTRLGAEECGDEVLMARTVWRRQEGSVSLRAAHRLGAVLEQLQPGRRPVPTPVGQR
jgi:hypothetical protein